MEEGCVPARRLPTASSSSAADALVPPHLAALDAGAFEAEITPVQLPPKKRGGEPITFKQDEHPRPQATLEQLGKLPAVFAKNGTVSAGNASGICDGAAANVVVSEEAVKRYGLKPLAKVVAYHINAVDPTIMGASAPLPRLSTRSLAHIRPLQASAPSRASAASSRRRA